MGSSVLGSLGTLLRRLLAHDRLSRLGTIGVAALSTSRRLHLHTHGRRQATRRVALCGEEEAP
jgi:hypothetical protein